MKTLVDLAELGHPNLYILGEAAIERLINAGAPRATAENAIVVVAELALEAGRSRGIAEATEHIAGVKVRT